MPQHYEYDETGQSAFFVVTFLAIVLVPWSASVLLPLFPGYRAPPVSPPCPAWNIKDPRYAPASPSSNKFRKSYIALLFLWSLFGYLCWHVLSLEAPGVLYDPFAILGISSSLDEKGIKRHFKRLSLKFHPDKLKLEPNQTKEDVEAHFVKLTKAYKALTDETIRRNYELYGHPDGKQDLAMGIALPKWIVESQNSVYVLGAYGILFGICLPYFVGRWWYRSRKLTRDDILTSTAATVFMQLKEETNLHEMLNIICHAQEFVEQITPLSKDNKDEIEALEKSITTTFNDLRLPYDSKLFKTKAAKKASILIHSHLLRIPINDKKLALERQTCILAAHQVSTAIFNTALARSWLTCLVNSIKIQQHLFQGIYPTLPTTLQLPHVELQTARNAAKNNVATVANVVSTSDEKIKTLFKELDDMQYDQMTQVASHWPFIESIFAEFKVVGEKSITPGSIVQLILRVRMKSPNGNNDGDVDEDKDAILENDFKLEQEIIANVKRKHEAEGTHGQVETGWAHGPRFPKNRKPSWWLVLGAPKVDRIFFAPKRYLNIGPGKTRTIRFEFQAPAEKGIYFFNTYLINDSYIDTTLRLPMTLNVVEPAIVAVREDEISDPEEDTIAGALAQMKGGNVKKSPYYGDEEERASDDDDSSSSSDDDEDESSDDSSDSSSSDDN